MAGKRAGVVGVAGLVALLTVGLSAVGMVASRPVEAASGPMLSMGDQSGLERDVVNGSVFVPVFLSAPATQPVVVSYFTEDVTATAGADYLRWGTPSSPRQVMIAPGAVQTQINVAVLTDDDVESDETFSVVVAAVSGGDVVVGDDTGTATIVDADVLSAANPAITVSSTSVVEGDQGERRAQFLVHLSRPPATNVTISYGTSDGTAVAGQDYTAKLPGTVVFAPGQISKTVDVLVGSDTAVDGPREFTLDVTVSGGSPVEELAATGTATILDDDLAAPPVPPVISSFSALTPSGPSPVTTALTWSIADPGSNPLTCSLDLDDDGTYDMTVSSCTSASLRTATFTQVGSDTVELMVSNGSTSATATTTVTVGAPSPDTFEITLRTPLSIPSDVSALIVAAAARWENVIRTGLAPQPVTVPAGLYFSSVPALNTTVDDVFIDVTVQALDGPGGAVAQGAGFRVRADGTTSYGAVAIDSADLATLMANPGSLVDTVTHEMGHVLQNATAFAPLVDNSTPSDRRFTGAAANGVFQALGGTGTIPMFGFAHWSEAVFGTELMTPSFTIGQPTQLSAMTVASLADLKYGVDLAGADAYSLPGPALPGPALRAPQTAGTTLQR